LEVNRIREFFKKEIKKPTDPKELDVWEYLYRKEGLTILDDVKDSLIPHVSGNNSAYEMWIALQNFFQNKKENWVRVVEDKLKSTKMIQGEGMTSYMTRLSQVQDDLVVFGVKVLDEEMVRISLKGFTLELKPFIK